jgi:hypothetical protein
MRQPDPPTVTRGRSDTAKGGPICTAGCAEYAYTDIAASGGLTR